MTITTVQQQCDRSCGIAALAMITNRDYSDVLNDIGKPEVSREEMLAYLKANEIDFSCSIYPTIWARRTYILTVPSLNLPGMLHYIVASTSDDLSESVFSGIHDPNEGRVDKKSYGVDQDLVSWAEPIEIHRYRKVNSAFDRSIPTKTL